MTHVARSSAPRIGNTLYDRFAASYDPVFSRVLAGRIRTTIDSLEIVPGTSVLDIGVGTGSYLDAYPEHSRITGIDVSADMLAQAEKRVQEHQWEHIRLIQASALDLPFSNDHFDLITAFHVSSVVPDASRMAQEMYRVCRPGGRVVIVGHFRSRHRWVAALVDRLNPITRRLGWRTDQEANELFEAAPLDIVRQWKPAPPSLFTTIIAEKPSETGRAEREHQPDSRNMETVEG